MTITNNGVLVTFGSLMIGDQFIYEGISYNKVENYQIDSIGRGTIVCNISPTENVIRTDYTTYLNDEVQVVRVR
ncbi:hypothetical protein QUQ16_000176 [Escherichia coli]|nr:hypothetical protein [Escherichia coli]